MKTIKLTKSELEYKIKKDTIKDTNAADKFLKSVGVKNVNKPTNKKQSAKSCARKLIRSHFRNFITTEEMELLKHGSTNQIFKTCKAVRRRKWKFMKEFQKSEI